MAGDKEVDLTRRRRHVSETNDVVLRALHGELSPRELAMIGYAPDTKDAINRLIEVSPVLEEAILAIADMCYRDGITAI